MNPSSGKTLTASALPRVRLVTLKDRAVAAQQLDQRRAEVKRLRRMLRNLSDTPQAVAAE
jgi:hypothetical protein